MKSRFLGFVAIAAVSLQAHAVPTLIDEGFDNVAALPGSGWVLQNQSTAGGTTGWFQGNGSVFASHSGSAGSYIAANFLNSGAGGTIDNWLITPLITVEGQSIVSFFYRGEVIEGLVDTIGLYYALGDVTATASFLALQTDIVAPTDWTLQTATLSYANQQLRLAIRYNGAADLANYIGIDSFSVAPSGPVGVPEPGTLSLLGLGGLLVAAVRRRRYPR